MTTATVERAFPARIVKADDEQRIAYGVVLEPRGPANPDSQGDWHTAPDVEHAAHLFMTHVAKGEGFGDLMHDDETRAGYPVESYIAPVDFVLGDQLVTAGSWVVGMHYPEDAHWAVVKAAMADGLGAFSVTGIGKRIWEDS